jgi:hypothetical protein
VSLLCLLALAVAQPLEPQALLDEDNLNATRHGLSLHDQQFVERRGLTIGLMGTLILQRSAVLVPTFRKIAC